MKMIIASRKTADDKTVLVWSDGDLTGAMGFYFQGAKVERDIARSLLIAEEACLFDASEMGRLIRAANALAKKGSILPGELRAQASK